MGLINCLAGCNYLCVAGKGIGQLCIFMGGIYVDVGGAIVMLCVIVVVSFLVVLGLVSQNRRGFRR